DVLLFDAKTFVLVDYKRAHVPVTDAAAEFGAGGDVERRAVRGETDLARKERPRALPRRVRCRCGTGARHVVETAPAHLAEFEDVDVTQEKVAFFREKQVETREVHLTIVHFGGGEIRVDRQRRVQLRRDLVEHVELRLVVGFGETARAELAAPR